MNSTLNEDAIQPGWSSKQNQLHMFWVNGNGNCMAHLQKIGCDRLIDRHALKHSSNPATQHTPQCSPGRCRHWQCKAGGRHAARWGKRQQPACVHPRTCAPILFPSGQPSSIIPAFLFPTTTPTIRHLCDAATATRPNVIRRALFCGCMAVTSTLHLLSCLFHP